MVANQQIRVKIDGALLSQMLWTGLGAIVSIIVGAFFWKFGADFTILALKWLMRAFTEPQDGWGWYVVPFLFSAIECAHWKLKDKLDRRVRRLATGMTALDMGSTIFGVLLAIMTGYLVMLTIDVQDWMYIPALVLAGLVGWIVTLYPERYILDGLLQLYEIGKAIYIIIKTKAGN